MGRLFGDNAFCVLPSVSIKFLRREYPAASIASTPSSPLGEIYKDDLGDCHPGTVVVFRNSCDAIQNIVCGAGTPELTEPGRMRR